MSLMDIIPLLESTIRLSTPLLLACLAGLFSERAGIFDICLLYTSPSPRDRTRSRMPSSA